MTSRSPLLLGLTTLLTLAAPALAGGGASTDSVQDGAWSDPATWSAGFPSQAGSVNAFVRHDITASSAGLSALSVALGVGAPASLTLSAGDLASHGLGVGNGETGTFLMTGGQLTITLGDLAVGPGHAELRGGTLSLHDIHIRPNGRATVEGAGVSLHATGEMLLRGVYEVRPTANGAAGLSTLPIDSLVTQAGATLRLDTSLYQPSIGDSWDVITYATSSTGPAPIVEAPDDITIVEDTSTPGVIRIVVTDAPQMWTDLGGGTETAAGEPRLSMSGPLTPGSDVTLALDDAPASQLALVFISFTSSPTDFLGGTLHAFPFDELVVVATDPAGELNGSTLFPGGPSGQGLWFQVGINDPDDQFEGASLSNGVVGVIP